MIVELDKTPAQSFEFWAADVFFKLSLYVSRRMMYADIDVDNVRVLSGVRCMPGWMINNIDLDVGNFYFETEDGEYPFWEKFGETQFLHYFTEAEINA